MSESAALLRVLRKLAQEAEAVKPIVKKGAMAAGELAGEANMAGGQRIAQKLTTGEEYAAKMKALKDRSMQAAAGAGVVPAVEQSPDDPGMMERLKQLAATGVNKVGQAYDSLPENVKANISTAGDMIAAPGAAVRGATLAAQTNQPILPAAQKAFFEPEQAPTGAQIADATGLDDSNVLTKTAIATANDLADPLDLLGVGAVDKASKLRMLGKLK